MFFMQSPNIGFYALKILGRPKQNLIQNHALSKDFWYPKISNNYDPKGGVTCYTGQLATSIFPTTMLHEKFNTVASF